MAKTGCVAYTGFRFRRTRGGTPDKAFALSQRGIGGVHVHIGREEYATMSSAEAALSSAQRMRLIGMRRGAQITRLEVPFNQSRVEFPEMIDDQRLPFEVAKRLSFGSLAHGRKLVAALNEQSGGGFRIPMYEEMVELSEVLGQQLSNRDNWGLTETPAEKNPETFLGYRPDTGVSCSAAPDNASFANSGVWIIRDRIEG